MRIIGKQCSKTPVSGNDTDHESSSDTGSGCDTDLDDNSEGDIDPRSPRDDAILAEDDHNSDGAPKQKTGPLSKEALAVIEAFGVEVKQKAKELATLYQKPPCVILAAASLYMPSVRRESKWNMYQSWYSSKNPHTEEGKSFMLSTGHKSIN
jgi:hypothetical protein